MKKLFLSFDNNVVNLIYSNVKLEKYSNNQTLLLSANGDVVSSFKNLKLEFSQSNGNTYFYKIISCD